MSDEIYELMRYGWKTPYPDPEDSSLPAKMASPQVYKGEMLASFAPVLIAASGGAITAADVANSCAACGLTPDGEPMTPPPATTCKLKSPLPPDCATPYRCYILFEAQTDECDPEWYGCPRTMGVFCLNLESTSPAMPTDSWFIMEDPKWLTNGSETVAWYLIEVPSLPGVTRVCSPVNTNLPPGDTLPDPPACVYTPCSFQDLIELRELCKLDTDGDGVVVVDGAEVELPEGFCDKITEIINMVEDPGKYLGPPKNADGSPMHTPSNIGICVSQWEYKWDPCLDEHLPNGAKCPYKGGWGPPKLKGTQCMSSLAWAILKLALDAVGQWGIGPNHPEDPDNDCTRIFYLKHFKCNHIGEPCRINSNIKPLPKQPNGDDTCVCPRGDGTYYICDCSTPGAQPGGWDPCDPANGYVPKAATENCSGGGIAIDDPSGGTGGAGAQPGTQPDGGPVNDVTVYPAVVVPLSYGRLPLKPIGCTQFPCEYQCTTCKGALLMGTNTPGMSSWNAVMTYHACEANLCSWEKTQRQNCQLSGPCTTQFKQITRTKSCVKPPGAPTDLKKYCEDTAPLFPGTATQDFYSSCPVCQGYAEGTWQCRGNPQVLTRGPWTIKFECKTLADWKKFFDEVRCNQWRALRWSSCFLGVCTSLECGVTWITPVPDERGKTNHSGDCPPEDKVANVAKSGDDTTTTTIGYTAKYSPCNGSIVARTRYHNGTVSGWYSIGTVSCQAESGLQAKPGTCDPVTGKSLNCAAGTKYSVSLGYVYGTVCTPHTSKTTYGCNSGRGSDGAVHCNYRTNYYYATVGSGPCAREYLVGGYSGYGPVWCGGTGGYPSWLGCAWASTTVFADSSLCDHIEVKVVCPGGSSVGCGGGSRCDDSLKSHRVSCIKVEYTRNDCKTPNPTAT